MRLATKKPKLSASVRLLNPIKKASSKAALLGLSALLTIFLGACHSGKRQQASPSEKVKVEASRGQEGSDASTPEERQEDFLLSEKEASARYGPERYDAPVLVLSYEKIPELGEGLRLREPASLEKILAHEKRAVLLAFVDADLDSIHATQNILERAAEAWYSDVLVVRVERDSQEAQKLAEIDLTQYPSFFLLEHGAVKARFIDFSGDTMAEIGAALRRLGRHVNS